jgi:hypothetical protein
MADKKKADVVLSDGTEVCFDLYQVNRREFRSFFKNELEEDEENRILSNVTGLGEGYINDIPWPDWRRLSSSFFRLGTGPLDDPNSASGSTEH